MSLVRLAWLKSRAITEVVLYMKRLEVPRCAYSPGLVVKLN